LAQFAVLITYREIIKKEPSLAELHAVLGKYQRREVIFLLAKLNCFLGTWQNTPQFDLDARFSDYLLTDFRQPLQRIRQADSSRVVFSRIGILYLIKQACIACPENGPLLDTRSALSDVGLCFLMANDLLLPFVPSPSNSILERIANLLPFADYISQDHYPLEIGRTQIIFDEIVKLPSLCARTDFIDIGSLFHDRLGLDHKTFCELIFGCAAKFLNVKVKDLETNPEAAVLRNTYFNKSRIPVDAVTQFFSKMIITESAFVERIKESIDRPANDLTIFQAFPLIEIAKDVYACLDPGFLVSKAGSGLYWSLFFEIQDDQRGRLAAFWGAVFESYVNYILGESYAARGRFIPEPKFSNGDAAFDACILEGHNLLVFEHKSSIIRADAKYGGDASKLSKELDLKFIQGHSEGAKGLSQLSNHLIRFLDGDSLDGISAKEIAKIYPILVCLESTMVAPYLSRYLSKRFRTIFPRHKFPQVVTPVFTLGISDVENLLGYLQSFALAEIFESYHSKNKSMLSSISSSEVPLLRKAEPGRNIVRERFSQFSETATKAFFGDVEENSGTT
jgi:hypothetical protein